MKQILSLMILVICLFLLTGCAMQMPAMEKSISTLQIHTEVKPLPMTADLKISEQLAKGEANGKEGDVERLTRIAIARALGQDPPSVEMADILVGMKRFKEVTGVDVGSGGRIIKITVTGYPAWYTNFRIAEADDPNQLNTAAPDGLRETLSRKESKMAIERFLKR
jgi:hypothetical protein